MNDNIGIGVMTSINLKERFTACKNTWLKDFSNVYLFGGNIPCEELISIKEAGEDWNSSLLKQQLGLKYMFESNPNLEWYSISGCDNILFKHRVISELEKYDSNKDYFISQPCGIWNDEPKIHEIHEGISNSGITFTSIAGGASFFISNSLMRKCYPIISDYMNEWYDKTYDITSRYCADICISYMLKKHFNIDVTHNYYMLSQPPIHYENAVKGDENTKWYINYEIPLNEILKSPISLHYIKPAEMNEIYLKYK